MLNTLKRITMKRGQFIFMLLFVAVCLHAQTGNLPIYGLVRQNFYTTVTDPIDSTFTFQMFDSSRIYLGVANPAQGNIQRIGNTSYGNAINLTGSALNPYNNTFVFMGGLGFNLFDLSTGIMSDDVPLNNPLGQSYFDNFRFNNSDSTIYGLARRNIVDPVTGMFISGSVVLAKADPQTGLVTEISPSSVAGGFSLSGSAIDPHQMVYYFAVGKQLLGLDLYNGAVYSDVTMFPNTQNMLFGNFTYSCADTALYGLVGQLYYSPSNDPNFPVNTLDSATLKLGKVNPSTGEVTVISPMSLPYSAYSLNAGTAIDPVTMTYYFGGGYNFVGVSMITGLVTTEAPYTFDQGGTYFDMMRGSDNCLDAQPQRPRPSLSSTTVAASTADRITIHPNPTADHITLTSEFAMSRLSIIAIDGRVVYRQDFDQARKAQVDISNLTKGIYILQILGADSQIALQKVVKE